MWAMLRCGQSPLTIFAYLWMSSTTHLFFVTSLKREPELSYLRRCKQTMNWIILRYTLPITATLLTRKTSILTGPFVGMGIGKSWIDFFLQKWVVSLQSNPASRYLLASKKSFTALPTPIFHAGVKQPLGY